MTEISAGTILAMNRDLARLTIDPGRVEAIRIEVKQLAAAIEQVRALVTFNSEPADFMAEFAIVAEAGKHD